MNVQVVLLPIPFIEGEPPPSRVRRQREFARKALYECARLCSAPIDGWRQAEGGAPLPSGRWHWSISHKRQLAAAAIAQFPFGIDVEEFAPRRDDLLDQVASATEWAIMGGRNWRNFFRLWTAKEATLKANGLGIGNLSRCGIRATRGLAELTVQLDDRDWVVRQFEFENHVVAVAGVNGPIDWTVSIRCFDDPLSPIRESPE